MSVVLWSNGNDSILQDLFLISKSNSPPNKMANAIELEEDFAASVLNYSWLALKTIEYSGVSHTRNCFFGFSLLVENNGLLFHLLFSWKLSVSVSYKVILLYARLCCSRDKYPAKFSPQAFMFSNVTLHGFLIHYNVFLFASYYVRLFY